MKYVIDIIGSNIILRDIIEEIKNAGFCNVLADEVTRTGNLFEFH